MILAHAPMPIFWPVKKRHSMDQATSARLGGPRRDCCAHAAAAPVARQGVDFGKFLLRLSSHRWTGRFAGACLALAAQLGGLQGSALGCQVAEVVVGGQI